VPPAAGRPFGSENSAVYTLCDSDLRCAIRNEALRFYIDQLGFRLVVDQRFESGGRWIEIAPPDGNASLSLALATPDSEAYKLIGHDTRIYFIT
jgi:hypothetical protein